MNRDTKKVSVRLGERRDLLIATGLFELWRPRSLWVRLVNTNLFYMVDRRTSRWHVYEEYEEEYVEGEPGLHKSQVKTDLTENFLSSLREKGILKVSTEEVLVLLPPEISEQLLFHLELLT